MNRRRIAAVTMLVSLVVSAYAANAFLDALDDKPLSAKFRGNEVERRRSRELKTYPAPDMTKRVANMPWGAIFKIKVTVSKSHAKKTPQIRPDYFIVTDKRIVLLNEKDNDEAVKKISAMDKAPMFEERDVRGITDGKLSYEDGPWTTTIEIKGNECIYRASHNSGRFLQR